MENKTFLRNLTKKVQAIKSVKPLICILFIVIFSSYGFTQDIFTVTKTTDPDPFVDPYNNIDSLCDPDMYGTLQWAIRKTNDVQDSGVINFNIPGAAPHVITLNYYLPTILKRVRIDGSSQPGYNYAQGPSIIVDGNNNSNAGAFVFSRYWDVTTSDGSEINGILMRNFPTSPGVAVLGADYIKIRNNIFNNVGGVYPVYDNEGNIWGYYRAIAIEVFGSYVTIQQNVIGTDITGTHQGLGCTGGAIHFQSPIANNCIVGGPTTNEGNLIAYNGYGGVTVYVGAYSILVTKNKIYNTLGINLVLWPGPDWWGNQGKSEPEITSTNIGLGSGAVYGTSQAYDIIEVFLSTGEDNANTYLATVAADSSGYWQAGGLDVSLGDRFIATATDSLNNTSEFSNSFITIDPCISLDPNFIYTFNELNRFEVQFTALAQGVTYQWDFGDPASGPNNTSTIINPVHIFPATGSYDVKLIVTVPGPEGCLDSSMKLVAITSILSVSPASNSVNVDPNAVIRAVFNPAVIPSSITDSTFVVIGKWSGKYSGAFTINNNNDTTIVTFTSDNAFKKGEEISIILTKDIETTTGLINNTYVSEFTVKYDISPGIFTAPIHYQTGNSPFTIAAGDLNNDGLIDLATTNRTDNTISVLMNDLSNPGAFLPKVDYATNSEPLIIRIADLNGDNFADIMVANYNSANVSVHLNDGNGNFPSKIDYATLGTPVTLDVNDVNGDGFMDIVTGHMWYEEVSILTNNGDGTFAPFVDLYAGHGIISVSLKDFDNDGDLDILSTTFHAPITILENTGNGNFIAERILGRGINGNGHSFWEDFDGDGLIDIVAGTAVTTPNFVLMLKNMGNGFLSQPPDNYVTNKAPRHVYSADIDGDGDMDILAAHNLDVFGNAISVFRNDGRGALAESEEYISEPTNPEGVIVADIDGDGHGDMIVANGDTSTITVYRNVADPHLIQGIVYHDLDTSGTREPGESGIPLWKVKLLPNNAEVLTNDSGVFTFYTADAGTYTVSSPEKEGWLQIYPPLLGTHSVTITETGEDYHHLTSNSHIVTGVINIDCGACLSSKVTFNPQWPNTSLGCPGFCSDYIIEITNVCGSNIGNFEVELELDRPDCFSSATEDSGDDDDVPPDVYNTSNNFPNIPTTILWDRVPANFSSGNKFTGKANVCFQSGICPRWTEVCAVVTAKGVGCTSVHPICLPAICSWDPNNIEADPLGCGILGYIGSTDTLNYTINFQNTGTAPANRVIIRNPIDNDLDITSFEVLDASHSFTFQILSGNILEFTFGTIDQPLNLPDSATDLVGSQGFIVYNIIQKPGLSPGTEITNVADIIFDVNVPVMTNKTLHTISEDPAPTASISEGNQIICAGETATFTASVGNFYYWNTGDTTRSITVGESGTYTVTVFYEHACESSVSATLIADPAFTVDAGPDQTVYIGYAPAECVDITAAVTLGASPYAYLWSNGETTETITVCPANTTVYMITVTDANGCIVADEVTVCTVDVHCGKNGNKVQVCHIPPDNTENPHNICISPNAITTHLAHGDNLGPCDILPCGNSLAKMGQFEQEDEDETVKELEQDNMLLEAYPNPFSDAITVRFSSPVAGNVKLDVTNYLGIRIATLYDGNIEIDRQYSIEFNTENLPAGLYFYNLQMESGIEVRKMIKMPVSQD